MLLSSIWIQTRAWELRPCLSQTYFMTVNKYDYLWENLQQFYLQTQLKSHPLLTCGPVYKSPLPPQKQTNKNKSTKYLMGALITSS